MLHIVPMLVYQFKFFTGNLVMYVVICYGHSEDQGLKLCVLYCNTQSEVRKVERVVQN